MNFLELCQALVRESGMSGQDTLPTTVVDQAQQMRLVVDWIARADIQIQTLWSDWRFMRKQVQVSVPADSRYINATHTNYPTDLSRWHRGCIFYGNPNTPDAVQIEHMAHDDFSAQYGWQIFTPKETLPVIAAIRDDETIAVWQPYNQPWIFQGDYVRKSTKMAADADISPIPEEFHDIIVYLAKMFYAEDEESPEVFSTAQMRYREWLERLEAHSLPEAYRKNTYRDGVGVVVVPQ